MRSNFLIRFLSSLALLLAFSISASASLFEDLNNNSTGAISEPDFLKVDQAFQFSEEQQPNGIKFHWKIADEYFLYKERFKFRTQQEGVTLGTPEFSNEGKPKNDPYFGEVHVIHKDLSVFLPVTLAEGADEAEIKVTYQGCAEAGLCYPPEHKYSLFFSTSDDGNTAVSSPKQPDLSQSKSSTTSSGTNSNFDDASSIFSFIQNSNLATIIGVFFVLGLGLTFTPCVFPMIPIITAIIAGQDKPTVGKSFILSLSYVLGMAITYAAAGVLTGMLGAGANVQAALQNPYLLSIFAALFVLLSLAMFGMYELQLPSFIRDRLNAKSQQLSGGHLGSVFFIGALSALVVSPCVSAPLAGALIYISATADAVIGGLSLFALGLGMGVPLILIAVGGGKFLPKAGHWMDRVKAAFGVMLLAVAVWLVSRTVSDNTALYLWAILLGASAIHMGALEPANTGWQKTIKATSFFLLLYSVALFAGALSGASNPFKPFEKFTSSTTNSSETPLQSSKLIFAKVYSDQELERAIEQANGKITMLDFYADWCISCKIMENEVFPLPEIHGKLKQMHLIKADVTKNDTGNKALLNKFNLFGPPSILFFDKQGEEIESLRVVGEISASQFEQKLASALTY